MEPDSGPVVDESTAVGFTLWPASRDEAWFELLVAAELPIIRAYAARRVRDPDDVVSEVFATAWRHLEDIPNPPRGWLLKVASNHVLHVARSDRRADALSQRVAAQVAVGADDHADQTVERLDAHRRTSAAMSRLSPTDAEVLRLHVWEELSIAELAQVLSCSNVAAKVRLHRARRRLAALLNDSNRHADTSASNSAHPRISDDQDQVRT